MGASSESEGEGLEPPSPHSRSDRVGWEEPDSENLKEEDLEPKHRVSSRIEVDFVRKLEPMLLEEHVFAGQRWDNV
eukprot:1821376-Amphidinium_carterae.1